MGSTQEVLLDRYLKINQDLKSSRYAAYIQDTYTAGENNRFKATVGLRANYWTVNRELNFNPRLQISFNPKGLYFFNRLIERDIVLSASTGLHYQPPFYREMRDKKGNLNLQVRSQKSWHTVIGADYKFQLGNKLKTAENINGDYYYHSYFDKEKNELIITDKIKEVGSIPRPTDQRFNFNIFFQDHLPNNENYKAHLNFVWGGGFAYGPPGNAKYRNALRYPSYKRADMGFSALLFDTTKNTLPNRNPLRNFKSLWITGEILNILGFGNVISTIWVEDYAGIQYAAPKRSTSRLANVRLVAKF